MAFSAREQRLGGVVAVDVAEAHQVERVRGHHLEARVRREARRQTLGELDVLADVVPQPLGAVGAQHEPELEATGTAARAGTCQSR